jgi:hypothetical protein
MEPSVQFNNNEFHSNEQKGALHFKNLFAYILPYKNLVFQLFLGLGLASILQLIFPFLTQSIVDTGINTENIHFVYIVLLAQLALFSGRLAIEFVRSWILLHISTRVNISILTDFLIKIMKLPMPFFDSKHTGDIMQRRKAMELLSKTKPFQEFMRKNSQLASLFRLPGADDGSGGRAALAGLQTRAQVNALMQTRIASGGPGVGAQVRDNMQAAQAQLGDLKNKFAQYSSGTYGNSSSDFEQPDFKPNNQKTKSFLKRLEVGANMQSQKARYFFPVTSDIGLSLGYKLYDKGVIGVGAAYKLGLGSGWQHIELSHQGVGLRSFVDYKIKGSLYISGGYEQNFRAEINTISQLRDQSAWQSSGLLGLSKKYKISKKLKGEMRLLWDFLSYEQMPRTQTVLFRVGYNLK